MKAILSYSLCLLASMSFAQLDPSMVTIVRDSFGVPHIFAKTDAAASYGLAWAHAEDDFKSIQENLLGAKHQLGAVKGKDGAIIDLFVQFLRLDERVRMGYDTAFSDGFKQVLEAYVQALNRFADLHPKQVLYKRSLPFTAQDVVTGYLMSVTLFSGISRPAGRLLQGREMPYNKEVARGSNAIAVRRDFMEEGLTTLIINPHNAFEGPFAWYECHLHSEEGLDLSGATYPGGITPFMGFNDHLGWAHTFNYHDQVDVYKLWMHPDKPLHYLLDDEWLALREAKYKTKVKIGPIRIPISKKVYYSEHGLVFKTDQGFFALRINNHEDIRAPEQWYRMCRSKNFEEFQTALSMDAVPMFNTVYADAEDNIYLLSQSRFPKRKPGWDYEKVLPGHLSELIWDEIHPLSERPQLLNPDCGYLHNANQAPSMSSCDESDMDPSICAGIIGAQAFHSNRGNRFDRLMEGYSSFSMDILKEIKFDLFYSKEGTVAASLDRLKQVGVDDLPEIQAYWQTFLDWDRGSDLDNMGAPIFVVMMNELYEIMQVDEKDYFVDRVTPTRAQLTKAFVRVERYFRRTFGGMVPLREFQYIQRGDERYAIAGAYDVNASIIVGRNKRFEAFRAKGGECYQAYVQFKQAGVAARTINTYGASADPDSPHYNDQLRPFVAHETKPVNRDRAGITEWAERIYHPQ